MSSVASLVDESPPTKVNEGASDPDGDESRGFDGDHGESQGLAELLASDESDPGDESQDTPGDRLIDLAEKLGKKPEDLYALTVALSDGKPMKIGELKDIAQKATDLESANLELETRRQEQDAKFTRMHGELRELVAALPKSALSNEALAKAAQRYEAKVEGARKAVDGAIPEWKDVDKRKAERAGIAEFLSDYGYDADYLDQILDPRSMRLVRDAWALSKRVKDALSKVKRVTPAKQPAGSQPAKGARQTASGDNGSTPIRKQYAQLLDS